MKINTKVYKKPLPTVPYGESKTFSQYQEILRELEPGAFLRSHVGVADRTNYLHRNVLKWNKKHMGNCTFTRAVESLIDEMASKYEQLLQEQAEVEQTPEVSEEEGYLFDDPRVEAGTHEVVIETHKSGGKGQTIKVPVVRMIE
jgi:hypothetical protein